MKYRIVIEAEISDSPKNHEFSAAIAIAEYFQSDVIFIRPEMFRTPDFEVKGVKWELKSPMGVALGQLRIICGAVYKHRY